MDYSRAQLEWSDQMTVMATEVMPAQHQTVKPGITGTSDVLVAWGSINFHFEASVATANKTSGS